MHRLPAFVGLVALMMTLLAPNPSPASGIEKLVMPGDVIEGHAEYESECSNCHELFSKASQARLCRDCHEKVDEDVKTLAGYHGRLPSIEETECSHCHSDHLGRDADVVLLNPETFNHALTDFELKGSHVGMGCKRCHEPEKKHRETPSACFACHEDDDRHQGRLGEECADCHNEDSWMESSFDHDKTDFALKGKHKEVLCNACHPNERYEKTPSTCHACHQLNDVHGDRYGDKCDTCHEPKAWDEPTFDHDRDTEYPLEGKHADVLCDTCHTGHLYDEDLPEKCHACHENDDEHKGRYGEKCEECHAPKGWTEAVFDHDKETDFELKGGHADLPCASCHKGTVEKEERDATCYACHRKDDQHDGQQGEECDRCHKEVGWGKDVLFDHDLTHFPLIGLHAATPCEECHLGATFRETTMECVACHQVDDTHEKALGPDCAACHNPNSWGVWVFDHDAQTDFILDGAHEGLACDACHTRPVKKEINISSACGHCHQGDDIHGKGFGLHCERCHNTEAFDEIQFEY